MRHKIKKATLGRKRDPRRALMKSLADSLILHGSIKTTEAKAKALRTFVEPLITKAKTGTLAARREIIKGLYTDKAITKMMKQIGPKYKDRNGGYTRITKLAPRRTDAAKMAKIELV